MRWREKDQYRWRTSFAWLPRNIGDHWLWLEAWRWRVVPKEEIDGPPTPFDLPSLASFWYEEHDVASEYRFCRCFILPMAPTSRRWFRLTSKPKFHVVGQRA